MLKVVDYKKVLIAVVSVLLTIDEVIDIIRAEQPDAALSRTDTLLPFPQHLQL